MEGGDSTRERAALEVVRSDALPPDWAELVERSPESTFCHLPGWQRIMEEEFGHRFLVLCARRPDGFLEAGLPLVHVMSRLFGSYLVSMPFLNYGGPIGGADGCRRLVDAAAELAGELGVDLLELRMREPLEQPHPVNERKVTVLLDLPEDPEVLWKDGLRAKVRSQVRRPMKAGMETRFGHDQVDAFYEVFSIHMRDLGTPVLPRSLFHLLAEVFEDTVVFAVVYSGDTPVAGGCGFRFRDEFELTWASSLRAYSREAPNMLLYWRLMERAIEDGLSVFNFGRCTPGGGTHRFKSQWGGEDHPLPWIQVAPSGERAATPNPDEGRYALAIRVWSRLPVGATRVIGPWLARRIP
ncbi:FemAB family PEP-CTERM system-associated protein [soil metagenome]